MKMQTISYTVTLITTMKVMCVARLYSGVAKTDEEFEAIQYIQKAHIYAIHKHK